jgi:hypothetical protein
VVETSIPGSHVLENCRSSFKPHSFLRSLFFSLFSFLLIYFDFDFDFDLACFFMPPPFPRFYLITTMFAASISVFFFPLILVYWFGRAYINYIRYEQTRSQFGCPPLKRYPHWDRILGLDYVYLMFRALKQHRFLEFQIETYSARGSKVWTANFAGNRMVYSSEPENMKAMSTSRFNCFAVEPIRVANGAITPFTGRGVSSSDGPKWQYSRNLVKPYFDRAGFSNFERLSGHVDRLLDKIPSDGSTVDMQPLFQRWVGANP